MKLKLQFLLLVPMVLLCVCGYMFATDGGGDNALLNVIFYSVWCLVFACYADKAES